MGRVKILWGPSKLLWCFSISPFYHPLKNVTNRGLCLNIEEVVFSFQRPFLPKSLVFWRQDCSMNFFRVYGWNSEENKLEIIRFLLFSRLNSIHRLSGSCSLERFFFTSRKKQSELTDWVRALHFADSKQNKILRIKYYVKLRKKFLWQRLSCRFF